MRNSYRWALCIAVLCGLVLLPATANAQRRRAARTKGPQPPAADIKESSASEPKLPDAVKKTLDAKFPNAKIEKAEAEKEGDATVYDIEFREGKAQKETDIREDGTMLEFTLVIRPKAVPKEAMKPITAAGGTITRAEKVEISYEIKDGKWTKLNKSETRYEVELSKGGESASMVVDSKGKVVEEPKWHATKPKETKSPA